MSSGWKLWDVQFTQPTKRPGSFFFFSTNLKWRMINLGLEIGGRRTTEGRWMQIQRSIFIDYEKRKFLQLEKISSSQIILCSMPKKHALFGMLPSARNSKFWPLITVSNKVSLQNQLQNPRASDPEESNEAFDRAIEDGYCSTTVANHRLIIVIRFVAKSYTHP